MNTKRFVAMAVVGIMAMVAFLPMTSSAQEAGAVANVGTATGIVTVPAYNNPVFAGHLACEPSMIYNASQGWIDEWVGADSSYNHSGSYDNLWYTHTTNSNYTTHSAPVRVMTGVRFPYIVQYSGVFYCFAHNISAPTGNLYMWTSHNKMNWTMANGGKAVLYHSATTSSLRYWMANPCVFLYGNMWYLWIECGNSTATGGVWQDFGLAYSHTAFSSSLNFTANMTSSLVIGGGTGAPFVQFVPDRNAVLLVYHQLTDPYLAQETTATVSFSADKALPSSYTKQSGFVIGLITQITADWCWALTPAGIMFQVFHNQPSVEDIYQGNVALTLDQFYDALGARDYRFTGGSNLPVNVHQYVSLVLIMFSLVLVMPVIGLVKTAKDKGITHNEIIGVVVFEIVGLALLAFLAFFLGA